MVAAMVELNQARFQQETALTSQARLPKVSLFDYLA